MLCSAVLADFRAVLARLCALNRLSADLFLLPIYLTYLPYHLTLLELDSPIILAHDPAVIRHRASSSQNYSTISETASEELHRTIILERECDPNPGL